VRFYIPRLPLARSGQLRNAPLECKGMSLREDDVHALVAFSRALTEDDAWTRHQPAQEKTLAGLRNKRAADAVTPLRGPLRPDLLQVHANRRKDRYMQHGKNICRQFLRGVHL
jgi:hypothetical protein